MNVVQRSDQDGNALLALLPPKARAILEPQLQHQLFEQGAVLWQPGDRGCVYFPESGMISILVPTQEGRGVEAGSVSRHGAAGVRYAIENTQAKTRAIVQMAGSMAFLPATSFAAAMRQNRAIRAMGSIANEWMLVQAQHLASCNAIHSADARFCRWLWLAFERTEATFILVTQETIADILGIRRTTVTLVAQRLQNEGVIAYSRGKITLQDRDALLAAACECCGPLGPQSWPSTRLAQRLRHAS